ncbi:MAG: hypothetical protein WCY09_08060 [Candidatus Omnitrophota bacterium]
MANKGGCKPGHTNNPNGRPPAGEAFVEQLRNAIKTVEKDKGKSLMQHAIERAYVEDTVLIAILRKLIPEKTETDLNVKSFEHFKKEIDNYKK